MKKILKRTVLVLLAFTVVCSAAFFIYAADYYHADPSVDKILENAEVKNNEFVFGDANAETGIVFYPGAKVDFKAYAPLMKECADRGIFCVCVKMPFNMAFFNKEAAEDIFKEYPNIKNRYIAGHSLGGAMAASYISGHEDMYKGLILLASYSTKELDGVDVLSVYGTEDEVLNRESYEKYKGNLPESFEEVVIDGGCHAYFGAYGTQKGDGKPEISREKQTLITADEIAEFIK